MPVFGPRQMLMRSVPVLSVLVVVEMVGGSALGKGYETIRPIFLMLLPSFIAVGGNVGSVLGSRVSSALHLGLVKPSLRSNGPLRANVTALTVCGLVSFTSLGLFVYVVSTAVGIADLPLPKFLLITFLSGSCLTFFTIGVSLWTCFASFKRGLDPDDIVVPIVTTFTDLVGIILLLTFITVLGT